MDRAVDLGILGLARVLLAVHLLGELEGQLDRRYVAAVQAVLGAVVRADDGAARLPPGHLGRRIAARRLAD